jgi:hypothetical protein
LSSVSTQSELRVRTRSRLSSSPLTSKT